MIDLDTMKPAAPPSGPRPAADDLEAPFAPLYATPRLQLVSGKGAWVRAADGRDYLDFTSGIAVNALGHAPAGLARVVARQMRVLGHCSNLFTHEPGVELARALTAATGYDRAFFCNSGAEGIEAALKFARAHAAAEGRPGRDILAFKGGFHGRTGFAVSATWTPSYREPFEPLVPGVRFADFNRVDQLDAVLDAGVCAVIVEPVQGEGGVHPAEPDFLRALRARTDALGATLIFDEVQTGMGRTGRLLAAEHSGVQADLTVMSKALGGGIPLAAVLMTEALAAHLQPGMHGCTFGGNPVAAAAGNWMLAKIDRPAFLARVRKRGRELAEGLEVLVRRHPSLSETRGLGLLRAVEVDPDAGYEPADLVGAAREHGLLLVRAGGRAVRLLPPLNVESAEIAEGLGRLDAAVTQLETSKGQSE